MPKTTSVTAATPTVDLPSRIDLYRNALEENKEFVPGASEHITFNTKTTTATGINPNKTSSELKEGDKTGPTFTGRVVDLDDWLENIRNDPQIHIH